METQEIQQEAVSAGLFTHVGKVVKIFPARRNGFIANDDRIHFYFHLSDSPNLRKLPPVGTWVRFAVVPTEGKRKSDRAIRVEAI